MKRYILFISFFNFLKLFYVQPEFTLPLPPLLLHTHTDNHSPIHSPHFLFNGSQKKVKQEPKAT